MAKIHQNDKGFKVIRTESLTEALKLGSVAICDSCNKTSFTGFYIAVLDRWYCDECYAEWYRTAKRYEEDSAIEDRNFKFYSGLLGLKN